MIWANIFLNLSSPHLPHLPKCNQVRKALGQFVLAIYKEIYEASKNQCATRYSQYIDFASPEGNAFVERGCQSAATNCK